MNWECPVKAGSRNRLAAEIANGKAEGGKEAETTRLIDNISLT